VKQKVYFPGLHGLRFLAALAVVVHHIEQFKYIAKVGHPLLLAGLSGLGLSGVGLFYVLSGFLITYLLLTEDREQGSIDIRKFYARRILRIWPLYYLIVLFSFLVLPHLTDVGGYNQAIKQHFGMALLMFLLILPHAAYLLYPAVLGASQAWSIGVEEHFYLVWPLLVRVFRNHLMPLFIGLIGLKLFLLRGLASLAYRGELLHFDAGVLSALNFGRELLRIFQIEYMTIGGIAAYLFFEERFRRTSPLLHPAAQILNFIALVLLVRYNMFQGHDLVQAAVFALFIVHIISNQRLRPMLDNRPMRYLGIISYGVYMFHPTIIALLLDGLLEIPSVKGNAGLLNGLLYGLTIVATIAVAALSYAFFESPFLKLKNRLEIIKTTGTPAPTDNPVTTAG